MQFNYAYLVLIGLVLALFIALGVLDIHALLNDIISGMLAGVAGAYLVIKLVGKRRRKK